MKKDSGQKPSIWVGLGKAGCKLIGDLVNSQSITEEKYVCIDSDGKDLETYSPSISETFELKVPGELQFKSDQLSYSYLPKSVSYRSCGGTGHVRALGRYYIDNEQCLPDLTDFLQELIEPLGAPGKQTITIHIINYIGGGTGSATTPLLIGLIEEIGNEFNCQFNIRVIGLAPQFREGADITVPKRQISNSVVSLQEYRPLISGLAQQTRYPIELPLHSTDQDVLVFETPPINTYLILPVERTKDGLQYPPQASQTIRRLLAKESETSNSVVINSQNPHRKIGYYKSLLSQNQKSLNLDLFESISKPVLRNSNAYPELYEIT